MEEPITRKKFVEWLHADRDSQGIWNEDFWKLDDAFTRTPLRRPGGAGWPPSFGSEIAWEPEDAARSAVTAYLEGNVRACGARIFHRLQPLVQAHASERPGFVRQVLVLSRSVQRPFESVSPPSTLDRLAGDVESFWSPHRLEIERCPIVEGFRREFPATPPGFPDVEEFAHLLPDYIWDRMDFRERRSKRRAKVDVGVEARLKILRWSASSMFGIPHEEGLPSMLREAASILDALAVVNADGDGYVQRRFADHIRGRILPRIESVALPPEDLAALDALMIR